MRWFATNRALAAAALAMVAIASCSTREDQAFRFEVPVVLRLAASLETATDFIAESDSTARSSRLAEATAQVDAYEAAVAHLPQPKEEHLRHLAMRLTNLGDLAKSALNWNGLLWRAGSVDEDMKALGRAAEATSWDSTWAGRESHIQAYRQAYRVLIAAERVCLGTAMLQDRGSIRAWSTPQSPSGDYAKREDSLNAVEERFVREEVAKMR